MTFKITFFHKLINKDMEYTCEYPNDYRSMKKKR